MPLKMEIIFVKPLMNKLYNIVIISLLAFTFGCGSGGVDEGVIKYEITYVEEEKKDKPVIELLPTEMEQIFKDGNSKMKIEGFMGMFLTALISNTTDKTNAYIFKVMSEKYYCKTAVGEKTLGFDSFPGMHLKETGETKEIAGYKSKKVEVTFDDESIPPFDVYYTNKIRIENPNWSNPYGSIDGVLLEFKVKLMGITMNIKAKEIINSQVKLEEFNIPDGFKKVLPDSLSVTIEKIMNSANQ